MMLEDIKKVIMEKAEVFETKMTVYGRGNYYLEVYSDMTGLGISDAQYDVLNAFEVSAVFNIVDWKLEISKKKKGKLVIEFTIDEDFEEIIERINKYSRAIKGLDDEIERLIAERDTLIKML